MELPPKVQSMLLLKGARLSLQGKQNVRSLTRGSLLGQDIMWAPPRLDPGGLAWGVDKNASSLLEVNDLSQGEEFPDEEEVPPLPELPWSWWADELDSDDELGILVELSGRELSENEISDTLVQMGARQAKYVEREQGPQEGSPKGQRLLEAQASTHSCAAEVGDQMRQLR